jgi:hypothetical protein
MGDLEAVQAVNDRNTAQALAAAQVQPINLRQ